MQERRRHSEELGSEAPERPEPGDGPSGASIDEARRLLGLGRTRQAIAVTERVLAERGDYPPALTVRTMALLAQRNFQEALDTARRSLELDPANISQLINKGLALQGLGDYDGSLAAITEALAIDPGQIDGYVDKSAILLEQDRFAEALETTQQGLLRDCNQSRLLINQATALLGLERYEDALVATDTALARHQGDPALLANRALALAGLRRFAEALLTVRTAMGETAQDSALLNSLVQEILDTMGYPAACTLIDRIAEGDPRYRAALLRACAQQLLEQDRFEEALQACEALLQMQLSKREAHIWKGRALARLMRFEEANCAVREAERLYKEEFPGPSRPPAGLPADTYVPEMSAERIYVAGEFGRIAACDWSNRDTFLRRLPELLQAQLAAGRPVPLAPFNALLLPLQPSLQQAITRSLSRHTARFVGTAPTRPRPAPGTDKSRRRLRVGYVSADFRDHATAHLMGGMLRLHDRDRFEVTGYALNQDDRSTYRSRIAADCDRFVDLTDSSNAEAARRIVQDRIDILVDLMGYTHGARGEIFALEPAPIQVSYLGFPGTLGADFIPYIIADPIVLPAFLLPFFTERPVYLPECYQVTDRQPIANSGMRRASVDLPEHGFVFCCFNATKKIEPGVFDIWMRLLRAVPDSVLWLMEKSEAAPHNLRREAEARGIEARRLVFARHMEKSHHLERHRLADLFLDTFTYNAHTTASDALWAGLPVLTRRGDRFPSRVAASLLSAVGLPELIADTSEAYERMALHLATHPTALAELRARLQANRLSHPLFDTERFVRHLEDAFEAMWKNHVSGRGPQTIHVRARPPRA